jgi:hypothetical protein
MILESVACLLIYASPLSQQGFLREVHAVVAMNPISINKVKLTEPSYENYIGISQQASCIDRDVTFGNRHDTGLRDL